MRTHTRVLTAAVVALATLAFAGTASAQANTEEPGVARLSFVRGDVSMQRGDSGDTSAVDLNTPLMAGDKVFTGSRSRAEIQLDWANMLRLDENADASIATLDRTRIQVQLSQGLASFSTLEGSEASVEIDTPNVAINPRRAGHYRIEVTASGDTLVTVREGEADISTPDGSTTLKNNELITVRGTGKDVQFQIARAPASDEFDLWNSDRDRIVANAESYRRTNRYYTGAADLDSYGRWDNVPDYGWVWAPRVAVGWAPYRHGRWVWTSYWGWTWTADEPWGWAPYHYGRWFVHENSWVWWPGPVTPIYRPIYAPAYVSFFGFGSRGGLSVGLAFGGFGSIGWLPAGPCDFVNPWWGRHRNEFNVVNVTNITNVYNVRNVNGIAPLRGGDRDSNVHNMLINNQVRYGLSTVSAENFGRGRADVHNVSATELRTGHFMTGNVPVVPSRESLRTSERTVVAGASRPQTDGRFFSRRAPSSQRESFAAESARVQRSIGPFGEGPGNRAAENRPAGSLGGFGNRNGNASEVNSPRQSTQVSPQAQAQTPAAGAAGGGWRGFGGGQTASGNAQSNQSEPALRAPRQASSAFESTQGRGNTPQTQAPPPTVNREQQPSSSSSGLPRLNSQRVAPRNPENPNSSGPSPADGQSGWQRFSGPPHSFTIQGNGGQRDAQPSSRPDNRPQLELNRPIIQPREFRGAQPSPPREPAPNNYQRYAPAPRSAPERAAPSYSSRPAPGGNSGGGQHSGGSGSGSRARSSGHSR